MNRCLLVLLLIPAPFLPGQESRPALSEEAAALLAAPSFREAAFERVTQALWLAGGGIEALAAAARSAATPQARRVLVELLRSQGRLAEARKEAEALRAAAPSAGSAELCGRLAEACLDLEAAADCYRAALELSPALWSEWVLRARLALLAFGTGDRKGGLEQLRRIAGLDREALAASAARMAGLQGEYAFAAEFAGPVQSGNRQRTFLSLLQAAHFQRQGKRLEAAGATLGEARALAQSRRERGYVAWAEMELHAAAGSLEGLVAQWLAEPALEPERMLVLIEALASLGRVEQALALLDRPESGRPGAEEWVSLALSLALEGGHEAQALAILQKRLAADPESLDARLQLSRVLVDLGRMEEAERLWLAALGEPCWADPRRRLQLCRKIREAGFPGPARSELAAMHAAGRGEWRHWAGLELARLWREAGEPERALALLDEVAGADEAAPAVLRAAGEALEELGAEAQAVAVYRKVLGRTEGEDLQMRLAWLLSRTGRGLEAIDYLKKVWEGTGSASRKRQAESQLLELSAKEGVLGDLADRVEEALENGRAGAAEVALLVNLYGKVGDTDSASDVLALFSGQQGGPRVETQRRLAQVYLDAGELKEYENTMRRLLGLDPGGASEWWMNLAISALERRAPQDAEKALRELARLGGGDSAFKAGVLAFAGLHAEAVGAYRAALAEDPGEVETWLLVGRELAASGRKEEAIALYQYLIDRPGAEDLFVVAVDGLLNLGAPAPVLEWAARRVAERVALLPTRLFFYRLLGDLHESTGRKEAARRILEEMVPVAAEQRGTVLRELLEIAIDERGREEIIRWGRRLMTLGEVFPPDVYLAVGEALLKERQWSEAARTFSRASDALDFVALQRRVAGIYLQNGRSSEALRILRRLIPQAPEDPALLGELAEAEGLAGDPAGLATWTRTLEMLIARAPRRREAAAGARRDRHSLGLHDALWEKAAQGIGASPDRAGAKAVTVRLFDRARAEMRELGAGFELDRSPRLTRLLDTLYRLALSTGDSELIGAIGRDLAAAGGGGGAWVAERIDPLLQNGWGRAALGLLDTLGPDSQPQQRWRARFLIEGRPPAGPVPSLEAGLATALWEFIHAGPEKARATLDAALGGSSPAERTSQGSLLYCLRLALGDRAGFVGGIMAHLEEPHSSATGAALARRISVYHVRNLLGRAWSLFERSEREALLEALRRIALSAGEEPSWKALYLQALLAAGPEAWKGLDLDGLVVEAGLKEGNAEELARLLLLVRPENRSSVIETLFRGKQGYVQLRFLALAPLVLGAGLDQDSLALLVRLFGEELEAKDLIAHFCRMRPAAERSLPPESELALLEALGRRVPGDPSVLAARLRCLQAAGRAAEARELAAGLIADPRGSATLLRDEALRSLVEQAAGGSLRENLLAAARDGSEPALLALVRDASRRGRQEEALALLENLAARFSSSAAVFQARNDLLRSLGLHLEAAQELHAYVRSAQGLQPHWILRAVSELQAMGRHREALEMIGRYSTGGGAGFDHGALQRLRACMACPASAERDRQVLAEIRRVLNPESRSGHTNLVLQFRQLPGAALPGTDADPEPTALMRAAAIPGALAELEGVLTLLPGLPRISYTPWELYAAVAWARREPESAAEFLARLEESLKTEPAEGRALTLGCMAAAWIEAARRPDWVDRCLALQMAMGTEWLNDAGFWVDRLERAGQGEAAGRLASLQILYAMLSGHYMAREALRSVLRLEAGAAVPDELLALALGALGLPPGGRSFGPSGDFSLVEEALAAGRNAAVLRLVPELEERLAEGARPGTDRIRLLVAAALARAEEWERAAGHLEAFLADPEGDGSFPPVSFLPRLLPEPADALAVLGSQVAGALGKAGARKRSFLARLLALTALRLEAAGREAQSAPLWAVAVEALPGREGAEALGRLALEEGRARRAAPLLLPLFAEGRIHPSRAAALAADLAAAGADPGLLAQGLRILLEHCPRRDLALLAAGSLPAQEARRALEAALAEHPGDPELAAALAALPAAEPR